MHRNEIFYALICINNHVLSCLISMLSLKLSKKGVILLASKTYFGYDICCFENQKVFVFRKVIFLKNDIFYQKTLGL